MAAESIMLANVPPTCVTSARLRHYGNEVRPIP